MSLQELAEMHREEALRLMRKKASLQEHRINDLVESLRHLLCGYLLVQASEKVLLELSDRMAITPEQPSQSTGLERSDPANNFPPSGIASVQSFFESGPCSKHSQSRAKVNGPGAEGRNSHLC